MNQWWILATLALLAGVFFVGDRYGRDAVTVVCDKQQSAEQQGTIAAQTHVIGEIKTQGNITQETSNAYHTNISAIDTMYAVPSMYPIQTATGTGVRSVPIPACGIQTSKKYKLTPQQCDIEEEKSNALWNWTQQQAAVK